MRETGIAEALLNAEVDNLRLALRWAAEHDRRLHAELTAALRQYWWAFGPRDEALAEVAAALEFAAGGPPSLRRRCSTPVPC